MGKSNFDRMITLADEVFSYRTDPNQLNVDEDIIEQLQKIHPATMSEYDDGNGPAVWILLIPTTTELMNKFLNKTISEKELYELTPLNIKYESLYLCSALVLEEYRQKGIAKKITIEAIDSIIKDHPIKSLFVWAFSKEGEAFAEKISSITSLKLYKRL